MADNVIRNRENWIFDNRFSSKMIYDKDALIKQNVINMLNKTIKIFKYNNLPDSIDEKDLEIQLQIGGFSIFKEVGGKLYCFRGGLGGEPNPYYLPTKAIIANPALKYNATLEIDKDCVVMLNDYLYVGLTPLFNKYASFLAEAEISLRYAITNIRMPSLIQADNDATYKSAEEFINKIIKGAEMGIISSKEFFEGISTYETNQNVRTITEIIEAIQYLRGTWYNELGLQSSFNMKREAINSAEVSINNDVLYPSIDGMLDCRRKALDKINAMFGTNITVELDSAWKTKELEKEAENETLTGDPEELESGETTKENTSQDIS